MSGMKRRVVTALLATVGVFLGGFLFSGFPAALWGAWTLLVGYCLGMPPDVRARAHTEVLRAYDAGVFGRCGECGEWGATTIGGRCVVCGSPRSMRK